MVRLKMTYVFVVVFLGMGFVAKAQRHLISDVRFNKNSVYVGEPVEVEISIFTSTWFTGSVNPGNIKVNDAFTVYFRSLSNSKQINGQTYAGVVLIYNVFPYNEKDLLFPSLEFTVETPDKGGYQGVKRVVKTPERRLKVKPIPPNFDKQNWLVTTNMTVSDRGLGNKTELKVGDVLERRISRNVSATVSELIPPMVWDSIPNVSMYPLRPEVENHKTKTSISASRMDGTRYLFEKEGEVILPQIELTWYNPRTKKLYKRTLKEKKITVLPNPDLGMLETVKDSLQVSVADASENEDKKESPLTVMGLTIKELLILVFLLLVVIYLGSKLIRKASKLIEKRKEAFRNSEAFYFKEFVSNINKKNDSKTINSLYQWIDKLNQEPPTINHFVSKYGRGFLDQEMVQIWNHVNGEKSSDLRLNKKYWIQARAKFIKDQQKNKSTSSVEWVNP